MARRRKGSRRFSLWVTVTGLLLAGIGLSAQRHLAYDIPWMPDTEQTIWSIEARIEFIATGGPVSVTLRRPTDQQGFSILDESGASSGYGLNFIDDDGFPAALWSVREASGRQNLYYRVEVLQRGSPGGIAAPPPPPIQRASWEEPYATAVDAVLDRAFRLSADEFTMTRQLISQFLASEREQNEQLLLDEVGERNLPRLLADMLQSRGIAATTVYGLVLDDGRRRQRLKPLLRVWSDDESEVFPIRMDPDEEGLPLMLWQQTRGYVLEVTGGVGSDITFSMIRSDATNYGEIASALGEATDWLGFSIHSLPIEEQAMFKTILLLPIGALVVCILRILVGISTSGTFMPVLIALAFIETTLLTGLVGFLLVVSAGLVLRSYLSHLNLLLVARISAVIITVITIIAFFSVFSYQVGLTEGLKITFFPMIILSWTVERMSILWEEEGWREVAVQGSGSLITAVFAYLAMTNDWVQHLTFNFIGLQLVVLALIIMIGNYNGYRLLELRRFLPMVEQKT
ncbi:MAG: inactive transglutaminase family protein [Woeseiaceae bacterium]|nr:inactive transglutaminase family protein [Woeseiaceae bacterium]